MSDPDVLCQGPPHLFHVGDYEPVVLTDDQVEAIAEKAAEKAVKKMTDDFYKQIGRNVVSKLLIWIGILAFGVAVGAGKIKLPG